MPHKFSGKQIIKAGEMLAKGDVLKDTKVFEEVFEILSYWRFCHERPLENALKVLQDVTLVEDRTAIFAKRLKRYPSIVMKLRRFPDMKLKNMQDIGGCRAIVSNQKKVDKIVRALKKRSEFRTENGRIRYKDYITSPKNDGYRSYHLVGTFDNGSGESRNIEVQIRTRLQHDWATSLEIVDLFTRQALKSNKGHADWKAFFASVSEQFAIMEGIHLFDKMSDKEKFVAYRKRLFSEDALKDVRISSCSSVQSKARSLRVISLLEAYANSLKIVDGRLEETLIDGYVLLEVNTRERTVASMLFSKERNNDAEQTYAEFEKRAAGNDDLVVALISTSTVGGIKEAYPNYFADSTDFLIHLNLIMSISIPDKAGLLSFLLGR